MPERVEPIAEQSVHRSRPPVRVPVMCDFRKPEQDWTVARLANAPWSGGELVLDVGCGPGAYFAAIRHFTGPTGRVVGVDVGYERLQAARGDLGLQGDATALPLADSSVDAALAMHMLYHVPDIPRAIAELRRVIRPGGTLIVSTNSAADEPEMTDLLQASGMGDLEASGEYRFTVENAPSYLSSVFDDVRLNWEISHFVVPEVEPVVNGVASNRYMLESALRPGITWQDFIDTLAAEVERVIEATGAFRVTARTGVFVCI